MARSLSMTPFHSHQNPRHPFSRVRIYNLHLQQFLFKYFSRFLSKSFLGFLTFNVITYSILLVELLLLWIEHEVILSFSFFYTLLILSYSSYLSHILHQYQTYPHPTILLLSYFNKLPFSYKAPMTHRHNFSGP